MTRKVLLATAFALPLLCGAEAHAYRQLAVGAAGGYWVTPGYEAVPVFTRPVGRPWTPVDTTLGYAFREPIYSTPRGYRYWYVRGYTLRKAVDPTAPVVVVKRVSYKPRKVGVRRGPCVTDIGYGRHEYCNGPLYRY
jgi:hypothetical protein